jgi:uncharacterized protein YbjT (DUF2867 family)
MQIRSVCLLGGSGFVGSRIAHLLAQQGVQVRALTRVRERAKHLLVLPTVDVVQANLFDAATLEKQFRGMDAVINLIGILRERRRGDFQRVHTQLPQTIVTSLQRAGVRRFLHMSSLPAARDAPSAYLRSKGEAEIAIKNTRGEVAITIFRPSVIFGPGDSFLNLFAKVVRYVPVIALACPDARFQPIYVEDVARAFAASLGEPATFGETYNLCGPQTYTLRELIELVCRTLGKPRPIIGLNNTLSYLQALAMEFAPLSLMTRDNYRSMQVPCVCDGVFPPVFGFRPVALESVIADYLGSGPRAPYQRFRTRAGRSAA